MIRSILRSLIFLLFSTVAIAQSTTVSATVVDSDSTAWANGTWSISFVPSQSFPNLSSYTCNGSALTTSYKGTLNGSGAFSQAMCTGSFTAPGGGSWNISICPNSSAPCGLLNFTTAGSTLDLSSALTAAIPAPRFNAIAGAYGYADVEARLTISAGGTYWNVASSCQRYYNGSSWSCSSSPGIPSYAVDITQPPYNAKCDSVTDDTAAIQAAMNSGAAVVMFPVSTGSSPFQCNSHSTLTWPSNALHLVGNGSILAYTGTGAAIDITGTTNSPNFAIIDDLSIELTSVTGSPIGITGTPDVSNLIANNLTFNGATSGALAMSINGIDDWYLTAIYSNIGMVLGASVTANHLEFTCFATSGTGLTIPASYISVFDGLSIDQCKTDIELDFATKSQSITFASADLQNSGVSGASIFKIASGAASVFGNVQYDSSQAPLFDNSANFVGNLLAYDFNGNSSTVYQTSNSTVFGSTTQTAQSGFPAQTLYSDNQYSPNLFLFGADDFAGGTFDNIIALGGYEPCTLPCTPLQDTANVGIIEYEGNIDPSTGQTSGQDLDASVPNNIGGHLQFEIDDLGNVGIGGAEMSGGGDTDNGDLFIDAGVGAVEKYSYAAPAFIANSGATVMDRCSGGSNDGAYVAAASTQAAACTVGGGSLVNTGIKTP